MPTNVAPPIVVGTPQVGVTLTVTSGLWVQVPSGTYTHQWQRCDSGGSGCTNIEGAESSTYTPLAADEGKRLRARVRNTNSDGYKDAWSAPTRQVAPGTTPGTTRVSVATGGTQANMHSYQPSVSADGRYVAFLSEASNLVAGDTNGKADVFLRDRQNGETTRVSVATDGTEADGLSEAPSVSADGRYVAFESEAPICHSGGCGLEYLKVMRAGR